MLGKQENIIYIGKKNFQSSSAEPETSFTNRLHRKGSKMEFGGTPGTVSAK